MRLGQAVEVAFGGSFLYLVLAIIVNLAITLATPLIVPAVGARRCRRYGWVQMLVGFPPIAALFATSIDRRSGAQPIGYGWRAGGVVGGAGGNGVAVAGDPGDRMRLQDGIELGRLMKLENAPTLESLKGAISRVFELAGPKILDLDRTWEAAGPGGAKGAPVFTVAGKYTTRGWTEWTQGFQYGMAILQFDAVRDAAFLELGRKRTIERMAAHVSHVGVHDHGFNNISTYGHLRRLMREGAIPFDRREMDFYELALKVSGAVQAARWTGIFSNPGQASNRDAGFIYSFNGPHSLFSDTMRSVRSLMLAHQLGHVLMGENDGRVDLLKRGMQHMLTTAKYNVYYGEGRDAYDVPASAGRVAHESIFNVIDGRYRSPSTQQGYSPFTTWTRGLAWVLCGFAEELEFLAALGARENIALLEKAAAVTADWWLGHSFADGMVYWDAGAPGIPAGEDYAGVSDPYNDHEPIDSSAAAIAGQGFWRLANVVEKNDAAQYRGRGW